MQLKITYAGKKYLYQFMCINSYISIPRISLIHMYSYVCNDVYEVIYMFELAQEGDIHQYI
jgi:hypothetical protein